MLPNSKIATNTVSRTTHRIGSSLMLRALLLFNVLLPFLDILRVADTAWSTFTPNSPERFRSDVGKGVHADNNICLTYHHLFHYLIHHLFHHQLHHPLYHPLYHLFRCVFHYPLSSDGVAIVSILSHYGHGCF